MKIWFVILLALSSCVSDYNYKEVEPYYLFHANSSKVWLIEHAYLDGKDQAPFSINYKKALVFHDKGTCYLYDLKDGFLKRGKKGIFFLEMENRNVELVFPDETWHFYLEVVSEKVIKMKALKNSANKMNLELRTFPEY